MISTWGGASLHERDFDRRRWPRVPRDSLDPRDPLARRTGGTVARPRGAPRRLLEAALLPREAEGPLGRGQQGRDPGVLRPAPRPRLPRAPRSREGEVALLFEDGARQLPPQSPRGERGGQARRWGSHRRPRLGRGRVARGSGARSLGCLRSGVGPGRHGASAGKAPGRLRVRRAEGTLRARAPLLRLHGRTPELRERGGGVGHERLAAQGVPPPGAGSIPRAREGRGPRDGRGRGSRGRARDAHEGSPAVKCARCGTELSGNLAACPICLLEDTPHPGPPPASRGEGARLGKLDLIEEIGRGGMGTVWRARHAALDRTVAVKLLPEHLAKEPEFRARFEREAKARALLDHPNIVRVHDYGQEDGKSFIVLELVEGTTLAKAIPLSIERALAVASELLSALAYAHAKGVVHRDVKPQNVLLDRDGRVKVTDFGIARIVHGTETDWRVTASNVAVGTPGYLAPEALAGAPPDPRRDIYAVGVVLYEMVTGKLPIGSFDPPPEPLRPIVARALSASVEGRY